MGILFRLGLIASSPFVVAWFFLVSAASVPLGLIEFVLRGSVDWTSDFFGLGLAPVEALLDAISS